MISIYGIMGLYQEAITLSLQINQIDLAKANARKQDKPELQKKLWLQIARHLLKDGSEDSVS